jgi:hypothetical protein
VRPKKIVVERLTPFGSMSYKRDPKLDRMEYSITLTILLGIIGFVLYSILQ